MVMLLNHFRLPDLCGLVTFLLEAIRGNETETNTAVLVGFLSILDHGFVLVHPVDSCSRCGSSILNRVKEAVVCTGFGF